MLGELALFVVVVANVLLTLSSGFGWWNLDVNDFVYIGGFDGIVGDECQHVQNIFVS